MGFLAALQFLTILPIRMKFSDEEIARSSVFFPLVGALLGAVLLNVNYLLSLLFPQQLTGLFVVTILIFLTGGLHIDGLADTFDALASGKGKELMLVIMKDSRVGVFGALGMVSVILFKVFLLSAMPAGVMWQGLFLMPVMGRWSMTLPMLQYKYAREEGKGKIFMEEMKPAILLSASVVAFILALITGTIGIAAFLIAAISTLLISWLIARKIGGMTGDTLGAICELTEVIVLLAAFIMAKI